MARLDCQGYANQSQVKQLQKFSPAAFGYCGIFVAMGLHIGKGGSLVQSITVGLQVAHLGPIAEFCGPGTLDHAFRPECFSSLFIASFCSHYPTTCIHQKKSQSCKECT